MADLIETTIPVCPWRHFGVWGFRRVNDAVGAAEAGMMPGLASLENAKPPTIPDLLYQVAKLRLPAENMLCDCILGRPCPFGEAEGSGLISLGVPVTVAVSAHYPSSPTIRHWDSERRMLSFGAEIVKQYRQPAPNQEIVLAAFEESGWPDHIDDPVPPNRKTDPKVRLHATIRCLNACRKYKCLKFFGDGTGEGIRWARIDKPGDRTA